MSHRSVDGFGQMFPNSRGGEAGPQMEMILGNGVTPREASGAVCGGMEKLHQFSLVGGGVHRVRAGVD